MEVYDWTEHLKSPFVFYLIKINIIFFLEKQRLFSDSSDQSQNLYINAIQNDKADKHKQRVIFGIHFSHGNQKKYLKVKDAAQKKKAKL